MTTTIIYSSIIDAGIYCNLYYSKLYLRKGVFSDEIASKHMLSFMREQASMAEQNARQLREEFKRWQEMGYETLASRYWMPDPADIGLIPRVTKVKTFRRERLMALGNGQVPSCVCLAETILRRVAV